MTSWEIGNKLESSLKVSLFYVGAEEIKKDIHHSIDQNILL